MKNYFVPFFSLSLSTYLATLYPITLSLMTLHSPPMAHAKLAS